MSEAANVAMLQEGYRRWHESRGGSVDHWMTICAENIQFDVRPRCFEMASRHLQQRRCAATDGLLADWEMIHYTADEFVAQGEVVFMGPDRVA